MIVCEVFFIAGRGRFERREKRRSEKGVFGLWRIFFSSAFFCLFVDLLFGVCVCVCVLCFLGDYFVARVMFLVFCFDLN